jgi:hypothetical protein
MQTRVEVDSLGEKKVPESAYYGIQTQRAVENFPVSGIKAPRRKKRFQAETWVSLEFVCVVRPPGFGPGSTAWKADVLDQTRLRSLGAVAGIWTRVLAVAGQRPRPG